MTNVLQHGDRRGRAVILGILALYVVAVVGFAASGRFFFMNKSIMVPMLFLAAALSGSFRPFLRDWSIYLSLIVLFDGVRGFIFHLINAHDLNVYMNYAIDWQRAVFGDTMPTTWLQAQLFADGNIGLLEKVVTVAHGSHFLTFLLFGFFVWRQRREEFTDFRTGMVIVMYGGLLGYLLVPTIPPWMAALRFEVLPEVHRIVTEVYNVRAPLLRRIFDNNPIAAMPSLHTAFPAFIALVALRVWGRRGLVFVAYLLLMVFSLVYGGEHYLIDAVGGMLLAAVAYTFSFGAPGRRIREVLKRRTPGWGLRTTVIIAAALLIVAEGLSRISARDYRSWEPSEKFARAELVGHSPKAHLVLGGFAFNREDYPEAQRLFTVAREELVGSPSRSSADRFLTVSAFYNQDYRTVADVGATRNPEDMALSEAFMLARSQLAIGRHAPALRLFRTLESIHGRTAAILLEKNTLGHRLGLIDDEAVAADIRELRSRSGDGESLEAAARLQRMLAGAAGQ